ncbi:MAG TPA: hypothetical protein EYN03_08345 [Planctomycetes bacterium]|nr:hypothetical protein [Planctomycetota bacterium]
MNHTPHLSKNQASNVGVFPILVLLILSLPHFAIAARKGEIEIRVVDQQTQQPVAVRMHLKDPRGRAVQPPRVPFWKDHFVFPGKIVLSLAPGNYTFEMERGPEYRIRTGYFIIKPDAADNKQVEMQRFVNMKKEGWWSGDLHIHRPEKDIPLLMQADDLHIAPVITWWNQNNLWTGKNLPSPALKTAGTDRYYHLLAGEDERRGGALLFFNLSKPLKIDSAKPEYPSSATFLLAAKKLPNAHVDIEKPFWWDVPMWVASQKVDSIGLCNNHLWRSGMLTNEAWGKPRPRIRYPDPHGNGLWSQDLYYRLLESGHRIAPSAGSASGVLPNPVGYNRVYVHCGDKLDYAQWWEGLRAGRVVVTNGPLLRPRVNGQLPGHVFTAEAGKPIKLAIHLNLSLRDKVEYLEVVKNGKVEHQVRLSDYAKAGGKLPELLFEQSGWMLIRAVTSNPKTYRYASTGPYYVQIGEKPRISRAAAQFFLDWVFERARQIAALPDEQQREAILIYHRAARDYWQKRLDSATVD